MKLRETISESSKVLKSPAETVAAFGNVKTLRLHVFCNQAAHFIYTTTLADDKGHPQMFRGTMPERDSRAVQIMTSWLVRSIH
jgi:hypothetical protein